MDKDTMHINFESWKLSWLDDHRKMVGFLRTLKMIYIVCCGMQCVLCFYCSWVQEKHILCSFGYCKLQLSLYQKLVWLQIAVVQSGKSQLNDTLWMFLCKSWPPAFFSVSDLQLFSFCNSKPFPVITSRNPPKRIASTLLPIKLTRFLPLGSFKRAL